MGALARQFRLIGPDDGVVVFRLVFAVFMPCLLFHTLATVTLDLDLISYPMQGGAAISLGYLVSTWISRRAGWPTTTQAVMVVASMVINLGFQYPFAQALGGAASVARLAACDVVGAILSFTWIYAIAIRANPAQAGGFRVVLVRLAQSPMLWAVVLALVVNLGQLNVPGGVMHEIERLGSVTTVAIPVVVGTMLTLPKEWGRPLGAVLLRVGPGLAVALAAIVLLDFTGVDRLSALLIGAAPVGFVLVPFAATENLDTELAVSTLSVSLLIGVVTSSAIGLMFA